ncbi:MAG: YeiH family protein [Anaerolineae bacterium]
MTTTHAETPVPEKQVSTTGLIIGLALIALLAIVVSELDGGISSWFKARGVSKNPLEYPLTAALLGLLVNALLRLTKTHAFIRPAIKTELFLKVGLVILGARVSLGEVMSKGMGGLLQAVIMVTAVFFFTWWLATRLKIPDTLKAVMATAVSICGVSAAIAAAGAVLAKKEEITYTTALVIITALPLMAIMPWLANAMGMPADVAGAWFGGNIDTTAAVVGAGTIHGEEAQAVATVVKLAQNVFIGVAAFLLALYFVVVVERKPGERPSAALIWHRFPKFVLGFVLVSALASLGVFSAEAIGVMKTLYKWAFAMAFVSIGLELSVKEVGRMGWPPVIVYAAATVFNTLLALGVAWTIFGLIGL